jgi:hypothetical protein
MKPRALKSPRQVKATRLWPNLADRADPDRARQCTYVLKVGVHTQRIFRHDTEPTRLERTQPSPKADQQLSGKWTPSSNALLTFMPMTRATQSSIRATFDIPARRGHRTDWSDARHLRRLGRLGQQDSPESATLQSQYEFLPGCIAQQSRTRGIISTKLPLQIHQHRCTSSA